MPASLSRCWGRGRRGRELEEIIYGEIQVEEEEREGKTDGTVAIQRMQEDLVRRHGYPVEMVEVLRTARMWYPGVQQFWDLPVQVTKGHSLSSKGS